MRRFTMKSFHSSYLLQYFSCLEKSELYLEIIEEESLPQRKERNEKTK